MIMRTSHVTPSYFFQFTKCNSTSLINRTTTTILDAFDARHFCLNGHAGLHVTRERGGREEDGQPTDFDEHPGVVRTSRRTYKMRPSVIVSLDALSRTYIARIERC